ncbi:MAG: hypothetical protein H0X40_02980 [Chthoniobacterales bacterium]|nr:hypothetical protein [Chthoniobacterales bacterium]
MKVSAKLYEVLSQETDRLIDRLHEAVVLDFTDARNNGPSRNPTPDVVRATSEVMDEYERLREMIHVAGGDRYLGHHKALPKAGASLNQVYEKAAPLIRKITNFLRRAEPQIA